MVRDRAVIHLNIADFAAGVETCLTPSLRDTPLIIAPEGAPRARVFDMNDRAFQEGVRKGMPLARARRLHPGIPVRPPRFRQYGRVMQEIFREAAAFTPCLESGSADGHLFLDVTGTSRLHGPPPDVAWRLRKALTRHLGLDPIWTLATNKLVAKAASRVVKPTGEYIVGPGDEAAFLAPLPLALLPGMTPEECRLLSRFNIVSVAQARALTRAQLALPFDRRAGLIHDLLLGMDPTPVGRTTPTRRHGQGPGPFTSPAVPGKGATLYAEHEFADDTNDTGRLKAGLALMAACLGQELRQTRRRSGILALTLTYSDTRTETRKTAADTDSDTALLARAWDLLLTAWTRRVRIRHMTLVCTPRVPAPVQAALFADPPQPPRPGRPVQPAGPGDLFQAVDRIRARFGTLAVQSGAVLGLGPLASQATPEQPAAA